METTQKGSLAPQTRSVRTSTLPLGTIFTIPKPFTDPHIRLIQTNAILSWKCMLPALDIVICGDDPGVAEFAATHELRHIPDLKRNQQGTPFVNDAFHRVAESSGSRFLVYCNADVILMRDLLVTLERLDEDQRFSSLLAFGRRTDIDLNESVDLSSNRGVRDLLLLSEKIGRRGPVVCKEYFVVTRDLPHGMPDLAVGRGNWDNWMVAGAKKRGVPVINTSHSITAIHQNHDYSHLGKSRLNCYVTGDEARANQRAAGGNNWISGCCADWTMTQETLKRNRLGWMFGEFWSDLPAFLRLAVGLPFQR